MAVAPSVTAAPPSLLSVVDRDHSLGHVKDGIILLDVDRSLALALHNVGYTLAAQ